MNLKRQLRVTACVVGLLIYGPLVLGLSIWGLTWARNQNQSMVVLFVLTLSSVFFIVGLFLVAVTFSLGYEFLIEVKRVVPTENGQLLDSLTMEHTDRT
jgi:ABC-type transport system involved in multi-copper enzyme maturation permease subunit